MYTKRDIDGYDSLTSYDKAEQDMGLPEMLVIDSEYIDWDQREEAELLTECVTRGIHLIFATLPEPSVIKEVRISGNCSVSERWSRTRPQRRGSICTAVSCWAVRWSIRQRKKRTRSIRIWS